MRNIPNRTDVLSFVVATLILHLKSAKFVRVSSFLYDN